MYRELHTIMAKCWTVTAKNFINPQIPKGFTVTNVITQGNSISWPDLTKRLAEMGIKTTCLNSANWEWK